MLNTIEQKDKACSVEKKQYLANPDNPKKLDELHLEIQNIFDNLPGAQIPAPTKNISSCEIVSRRDIRPGHHYVNGAPVDTTYEFTYDSDRDTEANYGDSKPSLSAGKVYEIDFSFWKKLYSSNPIRIWSNNV